MPLTDLPRGPRAWDLWATLCGRIVVRRHRHDESVYTGGFMSFRTAAAFAVLLAAALVGCASSMERQPPAWLSGAYGGVLSVEASPSCDLPNPAFEPFTWTISVDGDNFRLVSHSPRGSSFTFTSKLRSAGESWDLRGDFQSTTKFLGNGTFSATLTADRYGVIFVHTIESATNTGCKTAPGTLAGAKKRWE